MAHHDGITVELDIKGFYDRSTKTRLAGTTFHKLELHTYRVDGGDQGLSVRGLDCEDGKTHGLRLAGKDLNQFLDAISKLEWKEGFE